MEKILKCFIRMMVCCSLIFLTGCSEKIKQVSMEQLEADIPTEVMELKIDSGFIPLEVETLEVVKRSTEDIYDEIHCDLVMNSTEYEVCCRYVCEYKYYDQGGWALMDYGLEEVTVSCLSEIPAVLQTNMEKNSVKWDGNYYDVENVECKRNSGTSYEFVYDIKTSGEYRYETGEYKKIYSLETSGMYISWQETEDGSGVVTTWDIVGTYVGEGTDKKVKIVIDSYDPNTQKVHIASYQYEASEAWFLGGDEKYDMSDFEVTAEITEPTVYNDFSIVLVIDFEVKDREWHRIGFDADRARSSSMTLTRSE